MDAKVFSSFFISVLWFSLATPEEKDSPWFRLSGSGRSCGGAVQVRVEDSWLPLCQTSLVGDLPARICRIQNCGKPTPPLSAQGPNVSAPFLTMTCDPAEDLRTCNVSKVLEEEACPGAAVLNCSEQPVLRLTGSSGHCAGRVEIFMDGVWGSVCHDGWDALDAEVTCRQLKCGSALSALRGSHFGSGPPRIHQNGAVCRGTENFLWECKEIGKRECSPGEHAGVICTEYRKVRLSGGSNNCSGRVEVYLHGVWATICNNHWFHEDSNMLCNYLGCGSFQNETKHEHSPSMYVSAMCPKSAETPWDCAMFKKRDHMCLHSKAVGLICQAGATDDTRVTDPGMIGFTNDTAPGFPMVHVSSQYLVLACAALLSLLLASIVISAVIILRLQKKISIQNVSLPKSNERWNARESKQPVPAAIPLVPTITTTLEYEEDYGFSSAPPMPLVTFQEKETEGSTTSGHYTKKRIRRLRSASNRSSSTSSEEENWYQNYRHHAGDQNFLCPPQPYEGSSEYDDVSSIASD
ncbi:T-cell differentiation antigen CD6-like isoform X2 [Hyla sarda]|uniref:T-cell differentiation antigen CD6-like isoform X2 n=1 Tax=Hyla sarda TaxID=327740 RepID=UPI0024C2BA2A|nr:T-cell differentiation antigen CD6-like isoform X2 [Hyla sarda]